MSGDNKDKPSRRFVSRMGAEIAVAGVGILLVAGVLAADQNWFDRHFLPVFFLSRDTYVLGERLARLVVGTFGVAIIVLGRPMIGRLVERLPARELIAGAARILFAVALALATSELVLRRTFPGAAAEGPVDEEPLRWPDPKLGWVFVPGRTGHETVAGRDIEYTIDAFGYRVRSSDMPVDRDRPAILFTGESIMAGLGLAWDESIPAQVGAFLNTESVNMAVFGYANDQAYLRLAAELPHFREPVAVVSLFMPSLFVRNLDDDRPHLGPGLVWQPGIRRWRLNALLNFLVPYHSYAEIDRGIQATRAVLLATADIARMHHATPLVVIPEFGPEEPVEEMLRHRIFDEAGINYIRVQLDPGWRLPGDFHPDPRAAHAIAAAIAAGLQQSS
jgi:hypothetical protein